MKQTDLMAWIKTEHVDWYVKFHKYLSLNFSYWGVKQITGEYVWFCCLNESCQAGFILEYMKTGERLQPIEDRIRKILYDHKRKDIEGN